MTELSGRTVSYGYDSIYRLTSEAIASDPNNVNGAASYVYDAVGNRTQKTSTIPGFPGGLTNYTANDQLATDTYDNDGNTTASNGVGYAYDFENHVIQAGSGITMAYDGDGNRVSKTVAGVTTKYLVDPQNPTGYAQVAQENFSGSSSANRELSRVFVYGLERISQLRSYLVSGQSKTQTQISFYAYDGHGSTRALTDPNGAVTDTYDYDAFGNIVHSTATGIPPGGTTVTATPNEFLFAGEQFDSDLGLYYNRARYLNVSTGRFWTMDTFEGDVHDPISLHKFLYTSGDPVNLKDPSGNQELVEEIDREALSQIIVAGTLAISLAYVCSLQIKFHSGAGCDEPPDRERTFYHGTSGYVAETIVQHQAIDPLFIFLRTGDNSDYGAGFYMSSSKDTASYYAYFRAGAGQNGGPALVQIDIGESRWEFLVKLGAIDSSIVTGMPGQVQSFVPFYLIGLFNLSKTRFSLIDLPPGPGSR